MSAGPISEKEPQAKPRELPKMVLVVDDDPQFRGLVHSILGPAGYSVNEAEDGAKAIAISREIQIDLLITDLVMPDSEGIETIRYFGKHLPNVPIVAISGKSAYLVPAKVLGAAATLDKTRVFEDLLAVVERALNRR
jgi:two-component system, chemotaxis family, chemotaxis protein CheY